MSRVRPSVFTAASAVPALQMNPPCFRLTLALAAPASPAALGGHPNAALRHLVPPFRLRCRPDEYRRVVTDVRPQCRLIHGRPLSNSLRLLQLRRRVLRGPRPLARVEFLAPLVVALHPAILDLGSYP